jgi:hypothetical protein
VQFNTESVGGGMTETEELKKRKKNRKSKIGFLFFQIVNPTRLGFLKVKLTIGGSLDELEGCKK